VLSHGPALVLLTDAAADRHADILEENLVDLVLAGQGDDRAHPHARRLHIQEQKGDAGLRFAARIRTRQAEHSVGPVGMCRPQLRAI